MTSFKLYNQDCIDSMQSIDSGSIDLIVTDPPYKVTARGNYGNSGGMLKKDIYMDGDVFQHNDISPQEYAPEFYRVLKDGTHCYVMCNHINLIDMLNIFTSVGFHFTKSLIWDKGTKIMGTYYMGQFEYILFFRKGPSKIINDCGTSDILSIPQNKSKDSNGDNVHDTEKPVKLMEILISNSSKKNDVVLDPFMGSGTTGIASARLSRNFIGMEIDKGYYKVSEDRITRAYSSGATNTLFRDWSNSHLGTS